MSTNFYSPKLGLAPVHVAAHECESEMLSLLIQHKAEVNVVNSDGLTAFHILLLKLMELSVLENKPTGDAQAVEGIEETMDHVLECLR